jgi:glycerol-3-phosphate dehydrogenase (NAD(P)+)
VTDAVVVGATSWGTTLAVLLAGKGVQTTLLVRDEAEAGTLRRDGENRRRRAGLRLPDNLALSSDLAVIEDARFVLLAVPAASLGANLDRVLPHLAPSATVVSAIKGIDATDGRRMSEVIAAHGVEPERIVVVSGPNFAAEIAAGLPAATVAAGSDSACTRAVQELLMAPNLRVYESNDVVGVELGGALKNVVAIACGIADGLAFGENAKAALMTRALAEITRLGVACGAKPMTFLGLAGIGDLIATCHSDLSRNRRLGLDLAAGRSRADAVEHANGVAEGVGTAAAARVLATRHNVDMPVCEQLHAVLFEGKDPRQAVIELMQRAPKAEFPAGLV